MTTMQQVDALVRYHLHRDDAGFRAIVLQIAADAAAKSPKAAERLRRLVESVPALLPREAQGLLEQRRSASTSGTGGRGGD